MAAIASLAVLLTAKTEPFNKGMRKARRQIMAFAGSLGSATANIAKYAAGLTIVAAGAATVFTKKAMGTIDVTAKLSDRLGIATEDLIGLRHAAEIAGGGAELLDASLSKLAKNLGDPTAEVAKSLDKIGLSTAMLLGQSPAEQFKLIADGVNKLGTQEEKAAVAADLFGKAGVDLVNVLAIGRSGIDEMTKDTVKLGMSFNRIDASKVEEANDAFSRLHGVFTGFFNQMAIKVSPLLTEIADQIIAMSASGDGFGSLIAKAMDAAVTGLDRVIDRFKDFKDGLSEIASTAARMFGNFYAFTDKGQAYLAYADNIDRQRGADMSARDRKGPSTAISDWYNKTQGAADERAKGAVFKAQEDKRIASLRVQLKDLEAMESRNKAFRDGAQGGAQGQGFIGMDLFGKVGSFVNSLISTVGSIGNKMPGGPSSASGVTGTRGTFSGESASRMNSSFSITVQQLQEAKRQSDLLEQIVSGVKGGPVIG